MSANGAFGGEAARRQRLRWSLWLDRASTFALSLLLAFIVWLYAINQQNPLIQNEYSSPIPITVRGLAPDLLPVQDLSKQAVRVTVRAPKTSWESLKSEDFTAYIDLSGKEAGEHDVDVMVDVVDPKVDILSLQVPQFRIKLDPVVEESIPVRVSIADSPAFGYDAQTPIVEPLTVTVTGPATQISQVTSANAVVTLNGTKSQVERIVELVPSSSQNAPVAQVSVEPATARVVVPVEQRPGRKEVAVRPNLVGEPTYGYRLSAVRVNPSTVVLLGNNEALMQVPGFVETEPLSLDGATADIERRLALVLPPDVTTIEGNSVAVTADITPIEGGATIKIKPVIQGLGNNLEAKVSIDAVEVILSGSVPLLDSLKADDLFVILDLTGLLPGRHTISPRVVLPDGIRREGVLPETVEVVVTQAESAPPPSLDTDSGSSALPDGSAPAPTSTAVPAPAADGPPS